MDVLYHCVHKFASNNLTFYVKHAILILFTNNIFLFNWMKGDFYAGIIAKRKCYFNGIMDFL